MVLSKMHREIVINVMTQSLATYAMSIFKFPYFFDEIRSVVSLFWWGQKSGELKIYLVAWRKILWLKAVGGMGFRDVKIFNWALLGKLRWRLVMNPVCLIKRLYKA